MKSYEIVSEVLKTLARAAVPGVTGIELNTLAETMIKAAGANPYNKGYLPSWATQPYPTAICVNINYFIAHGVPSDYKFQEGDIVNFDLSVVDQDGDCGDAALTVPIGQISNANDRLIRMARKATYEVIGAIRNGVSTQDLARIAQRFILDRGYRVNRKFTGHGIGKRMHEPPKIYSTIEEHQTYYTLKTGMTLCIEPLLTSGRDDIGEILPDGWTTVTRDRKSSAMFEHMVRVTDEGCEVLTTHFNNDL